ncbi:zinc finger protein OZF isoform X1 [Cryptotermes secundus]|nr:zinc finger protein OZF isoform X1 [Cryptotermes secundus]
MSHYQMPSPVCRPAYKSAWMLQGAIFRICSRQTFFCNVQAQNNTRSMTSEEVRLARLRRTLHSLATRFPKIILKRVDSAFPVLKNKASVQLKAASNEAAHFSMDFNAEEHGEQSEELSKLCSKENLDSCDISQNNGRRMTSKEERLMRLGRTLHSLATLVPKITLTRVVSTFPVLMDKANVQLNATATEATHCIEEPHGEHSAELSELNVEENVNSCRTCKKSFSCNNNLSGHTYVSNREKMSLCEKCVKSFNDKSSPLQRFGCDEGAFSCDVCNKSFTSRCDLDAHIRVHTGERRFSCELCKKMFRHRCSLVSHLRIHTGERLFVCSVCEKLFTIHRNLLTHLRIHSGERPFVCKVCKKMFRHDTNLKMHLKIHSGERPFSCEVCKKSFICRYTLNDHLRIHTGERPFSCEVCKKMFRLRQYLVAHLRVHSGERPFSCEVCKKRFTQRSHLHTHLGVHTGERPFSCEVCKKRFTQSSHLHTHLRVHNVERKFRSRKKSKRVSQSSP